MTVLRMLAFFILLATMSAMLASCANVAPPGYDAAWEQRRADQLEWEDDPWR
ncbi:MAG: hypothetical protein KQH53_05305 [Desulfarculaceae bacterium]|nr:hypothetical protein [Desulfarculaceae bacterium]